MVEEHIEIVNVPVRIGACGHAVSPLLNPQL